MSAIASSLRRHRLEVGWGLFALANLAAMGLLAGADGGTIPFHFIWVSLTLLYGYTVWNVRPTVIVLTAVMTTTAGMIVLEIAVGPTRPDELAEVPLMAAMFVAMVWHARRRAAAEQQAIRSRERERDFIRDSSHHLKTPLQLARSYAELLRGEIASVPQRRDADGLIAELDRLARTVNGLLVFMTSEQPQLLQRRPTDLEALIIGTAGRWMDAVDREWLIDVQTPGSLFVDEERLEYALDALIENAVEATDLRGRISVVAAGRDGVATIRVKDDGHGFPHAAPGQVFKRFWSDASPRQRRGTGLGLAIVKAIVESHEGTVDVRTSAAGTEYTLRLTSFTPHGPTEGREPSSGVHVAPQPVGAIST